MSSNSRSFVDVIAVPRRLAFNSPQRFRRGVDFGADGSCLIDQRNADGSPIARLIWFKGYMHANEGVRGFGSSYHKARLQIVADNGFRSLCLQEGGRLSRTMILRHAASIDETFGEGTTAAVDIARTLVIAGG